MGQPAYNRWFMKLTSFTVIVSALERAGVRYIVAGGLAVNAHGYLRSYAYERDRGAITRPCRY